MGEHTYAMLELCKSLYSETKGAFSPALYNLSELWGFSPTMRGITTTRAPSRARKRSKPRSAASDFENIELRENGVVVKTDGETGSTSAASPRGT